MHKEVFIQGNAVSLLFHKRHLLSESEFACVCVYVYEYVFMNVFMNICIYVYEYMYMYKIMDARYTGTVKLLVFIIF